MNNDSRKKLSSGQWLFDDTNLSQPEGRPIIEFLSDNLV